MKCGVICSLDSVVDGEVNPAGAVPPLDSVGGHVDD
jgi:hypothetical protein